MRTRKIEYKKKRNMTKMWRNIARNSQYREENKKGTRQPQRERYNKKTKIKQMQEGDTEKTGESEPLLIDQQ